MKHYQHISKEERFYIDQALQDGKTQREIKKGSGAFINYQLIYLKKGVRRVY